MTTMLVWILVTMGGQNGAISTYSPPFATEQECLRIQQVLFEKKTGSAIKGICVQMTIVK